MQIKIPLHINQRAMIAKAKQFNLARCGRRFGKTILQFAVLVQTAMAGLPAAYIAPTAKAYAKRWREFIRYFKSIIKEQRISEGVIVLVSGATITFHGAYAADGILGNKYACVCVDESQSIADLKHLIVEIVMPTLIDYNGQLWLFGTPRMYTGFHDIYLANENNPTWCMHHYTTYDNPYIDSAFIDGLRDQMSPLSFAQEIMADWVNFGDTRVSEDLIKYYTELPEDVTYEIGCDLAISQKAKSDSTFFVVCATDALGNKYITNSIYGKWQFNEQLTQLIALAEPLGDKLKSVNIEQVAYQQAFVQEARRNTNFNIKGVTVSTDKITRFIPVENRIHAGTIFFNRANTELIRQVTSFPDKNVHDDGVDALAHAVGVIKRQEFFVY